MNEQALKMILAGKQLEIDKLKRKVKEMEDKTRKKTKRTTKSSDSN